jgi:osmotically-inducible protein OsmY
MSTANMTTNDVQLRGKVLFQLDWDPAVDAGGIGVSAQDATITLTGYTDSYRSKLAAERAAKCVHGVRAVANDIEVTRMLGRTDTDLAGDVVDALRRDDRVPDAVQATVAHAHVTLTGRVDWLFQKLAAERAAAHVSGVRKIANYIEISPKALEHDVRKRIMKALHENATEMARGVEVQVEGSNVTLKGTAASLLQRDAAEWAAALTTGVAEVDNQIVVPEPEASAAVDDRQ